LVENVLKHLCASGAEVVTEQSGIREKVVFALPRELADPDGPAAKGRAANPT
jgi:hypothetical protein